jgi:hypothetical protein
MSWRLRDLCGEQARRGGRAGRGAGLCVPRELVAYKRPSVRAPLVPSPTTSAHLCGGRRPRLGALFSNDRCRGVSRRRARTSIDHNSRGKKE